MAVADIGRPAVSCPSCAMGKKDGPEGPPLFWLAAGALRPAAEQNLAFRELEALARLRLAVFLALDDAAVAGQIAFGFDRAAQRWLIF